MAACSEEFIDRQDTGPVKLFFQDEARFGRIDNISSCWLPPKRRAKVGNQIISQYTYTYLTACPETGETFSLILPCANECCMDIFMRKVSEAFKHYRIVTVMDRAAWHTGNKTGKRENIIPLFQPPYSPVLNPVERLWHMIGVDGGFKNTTFNSLNDVELKLESYLKNLDAERVKSTTLFHWIKKAI